MVIVNFIVDKVGTVEVITREDMVSKLYSLLLTSSRCSSVHAYSSTCGVELDLESNDILVKKVN